MSLHAWAVLLLTKLKLFVCDSVPVVKDNFNEKFSLERSSNVSTFLVQEDCHPWMFYDKSTNTCNCSDIPYRAVYCDSATLSTSILDCYCMTYNHELNETELGLCLYGCGYRVDNVYNKLPRNVSDLNRHTCAKANRNSTLCGECKAGYSPLVYSYDMSCMNCTGMTYNWIKYIAVAYIPLTFFFLFVVVTRFSGTSPLVRGFISICQGLVSPTCMRGYLIVAKGKTSTEVGFKIVSTLYGIWNLDFFRTIIPPLCLEITPIQAVALDYAIAFYPLLLVLVTYLLISLHSRDVRIVVWLWKPFHNLFRLINQNWDLERSIIKAFATFFVLSYLKILNVTVDLLVYTNKYILPLGEKSYQVKPVLFYDPSNEYFRSQHLYYGIAAIIIGILIVVMPLVFLVIYPMRWFQKCLNCCTVQRQSIDMFVNCFQGYYKDGTNGTRDCRCFSISFFLLQIVLMCFVAASKTIYFFQFGAILIVIVMFIILAVQPYKDQFKVYSVVDAFMLLIVTLLFMTIIAIDEAGIKTSLFKTPSYILLGTVEILPALYITCLAVWWMFVRKKFHSKLPWFRVKVHEDSEGTDGFADRIENPRTYQNQDAPLLDVSQENQRQNVVKYGSVKLM